MLAVCAGCADRWFEAGTLESAIRNDQFTSWEKPSEWSQWRGGVLGGAVDERPLPTAWRAGEGLLWEVEIPGRGNSSPVVVGDSVLLTSEVSTAAGDELAVICIDRFDGSRRWLTNVAVARGRTHQKNGFASATVASDGERVFASFGAAGLFCLNMAGELVWKAELPGDGHQWGSASSPVLFAGLVIQLAETPSESWLLAFDARTGREVWRTHRESRGCWTTPVLMERGASGGGDWQLVVNGTSSDNGQAGFVIAYEPSTGRELWRARGTSDIVCPTAIVADDQVISVSNNAVFAVSADGLGDVTTSHVRWRLPSGGAYVPSGVFYRNRIYLITDGGVVTCHRPDSGETLWRKRFRGTFSASLVAGDGKLYAVSEQGDVQVFEAGDEFVSLATNRFNDRCLATPAISNGQFFVRGESRLYCIGSAGDQRIADARPISADGAVPSPSDRQQPLEDAKATPNDAGGISQNDNL
ncbi:MAG: PQQ-binding-like beta-propeller repeat protein [Planctomycetales bacterium]|nr:PQQ-binding-like beta-propeller repeat protein [Planctomycetales bacterium]